ncbi:MAG: hypothetical protein K0S79_764, partial [Nitrospira sp.]|nr:hypothetical protein [Nitrospira sp.]
MVLLAVVYAITPASIFPVPLSIITFSKLPNAFPSLSFTV